MPSLQELINEEQLRAGIKDLAKILSYPPPSLEIPEAKKESHDSQGPPPPVAPATADNSEEVWAHYHLVRESLFDRNQIEGIQVYFRWPERDSDPMFIFNHGAGSSAMTFASLANDIHMKHPGAGVLAYDMYGHGYTPNYNNDYSLDTLVDGFSRVYAFATANTTNLIYLVGHLLGGSVVAKFALTNDHPQFKGLVMVDIVEETAVESLTAMPSFVRSRPKQFPSVLRAIQWHMEHLLHNQDLARISVPDLIDEDLLTFKTDLAVTQPYWETWFGGLSGNFLAFRGPKLLILSTHKSLDKLLIVGQMQGKYQLVAFNNSSETGHFVHEDLPVQVAVTLLDFVKRNENPTKFMEEELGIIPKWGGKINKLSS